MTTTRVFFAGTAIGAAFMYFFNPRCGSRRRATAGKRLLQLSRQVAGAFYAVPAIGGEIPEVRSSVRRAKLYGPAAPTVDALRPGIQQTRYPATWPESSHWLPEPAEVPLPEPAGRFPRARD